MYVILEFFKFEVIYGKVYVNMAAIFSKSISEKFNNLEEYDIGPTHPYHAILTELFGEDWRPTIVCYECGKKAPDAITFATCYCHSRNICEECEFSNYLLTDTANAANTICANCRTTPEFIGTNENESWYGIAAMNLHQTLIKYAQHMTGRIIYFLWSLHKTKNMAAVVREIIYSVKCLRSAYYHADKKIFKCIITSHARILFLVRNYKIRLIPGDAIPLIPLKRQVIGSKYQYIMYEIYNYHLLEPGDIKITCNDSRAVAMVLRSGLIKIRFLRNEINHLKIKINGYMLIDAPTSQLDEADND
jgi:hypothetical protein